MCEKTARMMFGGCHQAKLRLLLLGLFGTWSPSFCLAQTTADSPSSSPSQFLESFTPVPTPSPTIAKPRPLKLDLHDVNILVVTDPHGWVAGHAYKYVDFDFGDLLAFYETLHKQVVEHHEKDLLLVLNGDFMHGNLLAEDPNVILPIMRDLPWDAVTFGEHDLYNQTHVLMHTQPGGIVDYWGEKLVTSNIDVPGRGPLGNRFTKILLPKSDKTILVLGFLDPTLQPEVADIVALKEIDQTVNSLRSELNQDSIDGILVMAHMGIQSPGLRPLLAQLRTIVGNDMPIEFVTGHTHTVALQSLDTKSLALEAGYNMHQMGFISFDFDTFNNEGIFLETRDKDNLAEIVGVEKLETSNGDRLKDSISSLVSSVGEDNYYEVLGCAPQSYSRTAPITADNSLYRLWQEQVAPNFVLFPLAEDAETWNVLAHVRFDDLFQNDLPEGRITRNDIASIVYHDDEIFKVCVRLAGDKIQRFVGSFAGKETFLEGSSPISVFATPTDDPEVYKEGRYSLFTKRSEVQEAHQKLSDERARHPVTEAMNITIRQAFEHYVKWNWPCEGAKPTSPRPPDLVGHVPGEDDGTGSDGSSGGDRDSDINEGEDLVDEVDKIARGVADHPGKSVLIILGALCGICLIVVGVVGHRRRRRVIQERNNKLRRSEIMTPEALNYSDHDIKLENSEEISGGDARDGLTNQKGGSMRELFQRKNKTDDIRFSSDSNLIDIVRNDSNEIV